MLYASLICSGIILVAAILATRGDYEKEPVRETLAWATAVAVVPALVMFIFPAVWIQVGIMFGGLLLAGAFGRGRRAVVPVSVAAVLVAYGYMGIRATEKQGERDRLRAEYPFESMEERLPRAVPASAGGDSERLGRLENAVAVTPTAARPRSPDSTSARSTRSSVARASGSGGWASSPSRPSGT